MKRIIEQSRAILPVFLSLFPLFPATSATQTPNLSKDRAQVGSVFSVPVPDQGKMYFVTTAGVLVEANEDFKKPKKLFEGKRQSLGAAILVDGKLIWGDGVHTDSKSELHVYDLKKKKQEKSIEVDGHIEREPLSANGTLYVPAGPGGVQAFDLKTLKLKWRSGQHDGKNPHVDSNLVLAGSEICGTSVYEVKGVICFDASNGKETRFGALKRDPKSEIVLQDGVIAGFATEADMVKAKFDLPSDLYVFDLKEGKMRFVKELRGFNYFAPSIEGEDAFVTLSTGDFILVNLKTQKVFFLGEYNEPFINNPFRMGKDFCGVGIAGKYHCFMRTADGTPAISRDKRIMELSIGKVLLKGDKVIVPTRASYVTE
ncbi:MAG: hypothetical protein EBX52_04005 [Proteobacteria bacterium]|nr:hypothetical protein [Pseudomonadota bacterium]